MNIWQTARRWLGFYSPVLAMQLVEQEVRYVVRQGTRILAQGCCPVPNAIADGHLTSPAALAQALLPKLPKVKGQVAALLPARWLHMHEMTLPKGLDREELNYQINRHITHTLGLSLNDVFFDWATLTHAADKRVMTIQLAIARQTDIAPFYEVFVDTDWEMKWVCAESQIWGRAYKDMAVAHTVAVCQVEQRDINLWVVDANAQVRSFYKRLEDEHIEQAGFVYQTTRGQGDTIQLPARFIGEELAVLLPAWMGQNSIFDLSAIYVTGRGVDWQAGIPLIQARLGLPIYSVEDTLYVDKFSAHPLHMGAGSAILWHLSQQVNL